MQYFVRRDTIRPHELRHSVGIGGPHTKSPQIGHFPTRGAGPDKGDKMDILDITDQMERYGQIVAFAPYWSETDNTALVVKLDKMDNNGNRYYVVIWHEESKTLKIWHSAQTWRDAAKAFKNVTDLY